MRKTVLIGVACSLLLLGCGSDAQTGETGATGAPVDSVAATVATSVDSVDSVAGTALTPVAFCAGNEGEIYFGYDNESSEVVVVAEGDANRLSGAVPDDNPLLTTLFAPGAVDVAFWAYPDGDDVVWSLTGSDGVERTASGGAATTPGCPDEFATIDDDRTPAIEVVGQTLSADGESVDVQLRLVGVDETSVCNAAFDPEPVLASLGDGSALPTGFDPDATVTAGPFSVSTISTDGGQVASTVVYALVVDQCSGAGVTAASWSPAPAVSGLISGTTFVCARLDDAGELTVELVPSCGLPLIAGSSIRPR